MATYISTPVIFSTKVLEELKTKLVLGQIAHRDYEKDLTHGTEIVIPGRGKPTVGAYTGTVTWKEVSDSKLTMKIDQQNYWATIIHDIDKFQSDIEYMAGYAKDGGYGLEKLVDTNIAALYSKSAFAAVLDDDNVDTATAIGDITYMHTCLAEADVPDENMWIVIPPWLADKLQLAGIVQADKINGELVNGYIGRVLHFNMYVSNNLGYAGAVALRDHYVMAGSYDAIAYVGQLKESQIFEKLEDKFAGGVRQLHVWGSKVVKPRELIYSTLKYAAEVGI